MTKTKKSKGSILSRIRTWHWKRKAGKYAESRHLTERPVEMQTTYYKRVKNKGHKDRYIWVFVSNQGLLHIRMPATFKPTSKSLVLEIYPKGHTPKYGKK